MERILHDDDIFVEIIDLGNTKASEVVVQNDDGSYTVFINARVSFEKQQESIKHALHHIENGDLIGEDLAGVQKSESVAHDVTRRSMRCLAS